MVDLYPRQVTTNTIAESLSGLRDLDVLLETWGFAPLTDAQLDCLPALKALFYAAGSVKYFAPPLLKRGITIVTGAAANAVPVAEPRLGQILLSNRGYFRNCARYREAGDTYLEAFRGEGELWRKCIAPRCWPNREKSGGPAASLSAQRARLRSFSESRRNASKLGVEKVDLEAAFARGNIVLNRLADLPETSGLLHKRLFTSMPPSATFINTGRGRTVKHPDLIDVLRARPDLPLCSM